MRNPKEFDLVYSTIDCKIVKQCQNLLLTCSNLQLWHFLQSNNNDPPDSFIKTMKSVLSLINVE